MTTLIGNQNMILLETFYINNEIRRLYLEKTHFNCKGMDQYFLKLYSLNPNGSYKCDGYIYFYLDEVKKESTFIGIYVKPECRNIGIASLLVSSWLKKCMDYGYQNFTTNKKQRKPFLIYLLKKMGFEINDITKYELSDFTIGLYQSPENYEKYLSFKAAKYAEIFMRGSIAKEDNYCLLPNEQDSFIFLDQILLSNIYTLQDDNEAYTRSRKKLETYK